MNKKPERKPDNVEQSKRFIETAEQVGADDDALARAFKKIISAPPRAERSARVAPVSDAAKDRQKK